MSGSHLTEAASALTNNPPGADPRATLWIDWAAFVTEALAGAAANAVGIDTILAGRPGSREASVMGDALRAAAGHDEWNLWRHRTEPVTVVLNPERILFNNDASIYFDELGAHEGEMQRRESAIRIIWGLRANPNARLSGYWQLDSKAHLTH